MISVELLRAAEASGAEQCWPVDSGCFLLQLLPGPDLGAVLKVLALVDRLVRLRDLGLEIHDAPGCTLRIGVACVLEDGLNIGFVLVARFGHLRIGGKVIFALWKPDAALHEVWKLLAGRRQTLRHEDA